MRWGLFGAAGVVFVLRPKNEPTLVMLQRRSVLAHEGGTWSCAGGAIDEGESAFQAALREASEEVGKIPPHGAVLGEFVFAPSTDWSYTTVVLQVDEMFGGSMNFETDAVAWVPLATVDSWSLKEGSLHAGFATAWPHLRTIIEGAV